jgi:putative hydrolase of the HAD superfamily
MNNLATVSDMLFDVDGVLVHPFRFRTFLGSHYGITAQMTSAFFSGPFRACVTGQAELAEVLPPYLSQWGWQSTTSDFIATWMREDAAADHSMRELVGKVRNLGFRCHVASVQERNRADYLRHTMGFQDAFDETFFSCDLGAAKPDPAFYTRIQKKLGKAPRQLMLIDDSLACVEAALAAGWQAFHYAGTVDRSRLIELLADCGDRRASESRHAGR